MTEDAHIIEIDSIVLDGVGHLRPLELRALVAAELSRSLRGSKLLPVGGVETSGAAIAGAVASAVDRAVNGGTGDA